MAPAFYAAGIAVKIKDQSLRFRAVEMQPVNAYTGLNIKKQFFKRDIVFEFKILPQLLGLKNKLVLQQVNQQAQHSYGDDDIEETCIQ